MSIDNINSTNVTILLTISCILSLLSITIGIIYFVQVYGFQTFKYFRYNTTAVVICNTLCALLVSAYFLWLIVDSIPPNTAYFMHPSHHLRVVITVLWYIAKCFIFFIYNGRLYYSFKNVKFRTPRKLFISLNVFLISITPICLLLGFIGIFVWENGALQWIGFNLYRITYISLLLWLSYLFTKRIFILLSRNTTQVWLTYSKISTEPDREESITNNESNVDLESLTEISEYLGVIIKGNLLLTFIILSKILVMSVWFTHNLIYYQHLSMSISLLVMSFDSFMDILCVVLLFKEAQMYYSILCGCTVYDKENNTKFQFKGFHHCCEMCCVYCGQKCRKSRREREITDHEVKNKHNLL
eukprot:367318_1